MTQADRKSVTSKKQSGGLDKARADEPVRQLLNKVQPGTEWETSKANLGILLVMRIISHYTLLSETQNMHTNVD